MKYLLMFLFIFIILSSFILGFNINIFNNNLNLENLTYIEDSNITRELNLPRYVNVTNANLTIQGYNFSNNFIYCRQNLVNETNNCGALDTGSYGFDPSNWTNPEKFTDKNISSFMIAEGSGTHYFYINYTIPTKAIGKNLYESDIDGTRQNYTISADCMNNSVLQLRIRIVIPTGIGVPSRLDSCYDGSNWLNIALQTDTFGNPSESLIYWNITTNGVYPSNPYLEIGNTDNIYEWNYSGNFSGINITNDFSQVLRNIMKDGNCNCTSCNILGKNCNIPFLFHSDTIGILQYSNISINYFDISTPSFSNIKNSSNSSLPKRYDNITINITIFDDINLSYYIFSTNITGIWINKTYLTNIDELNISLQQNITNSTDKTFYWYFFANDTSGNSNTTDIFSIPIINTPPTTSVSIVPSPITESQQANCSSVYSDFDDDTEKNTFYEWFINGITTNVTSQNLSATNFTAGDKLICQVIVNDGFDNSTPVNSSQVIVGDSTPPVINKLSSSSSTADLDSTITFTINVTDSSSLIETDACILEFFVSTRSPDRFNITTNSKSGDEVSKTQAMDTIGTWEWQKVWCDDSSGNRVQNLSVGINVTVSAASSTTSSSGGGGSSRLVVNPTNITATLLFDTFEGSYTIIATPTNASKDFVFQNIGSGSIKDADIVITKELQPYITKACVLSLETGECKTKNIDIASGETAILRTSISLDTNFPAKVEGQIIIDETSKFAFNSGKKHTFNIVLARVPGYRLIKFNSKTFKTTEKAGALIALLEVALIGSYLIQLGTGVKLFPL